MTRSGSDDGPDGGRDGRASAGPPGDAGNGWGRDARRVRRSGRHAAPEPDPVGAAVDGSPAPEPVPAAVEPWVELPPPYPAGGRHAGAAAPERRRRTGSHRLEPADAEPVPPPEWPRDGGAGPEPYLPGGGDHWSIPGRMADLPAGGRWSTPTGAPAEPDPWSTAVAPVDRSAGDQRSVPGTADRSGADWSGADRSGADRSGADRSGADRSGAGSGADWSGADRSGAGGGWRTGPDPADRDAGGPYPAELPGGGPAVNGHRGGEAPRYERPYRAEPSDGGPVNGDRAGINGHGGYLPADPRPAERWPDLGGGRVNGSTPHLDDRPAVPGPGFPAYRSPLVDRPLNGHAPTVPPEIGAPRWGDVPAAGPRIRPEPTAAPPPAPTQDGLDEQTQVLRRYVPVEEVLHREDRDRTDRTDRDRTGGTTRATRSVPTRPAHPPRAVVRRRRARRRMLEWPFLIVFALLSAFLIRSFVVQTFYIPSGSMHETLLEGDRVLVNKVGYHLHDVHRGDVVVFRRPPNFPVEDEDLIKRVVALPGETVEGHDRKVFVNGRPLGEPYVEPSCTGTDDFPRLTVPPGTLWMMGDNRCNSSDSRVFGPISRDLVVGRAFVLAWPFDRLSWL